MADRKALVLDGGRVRQIDAGDRVEVGAGIAGAAPGDLTIGDSGQLTVISGDFAVNGSFTVPVASLPIVGYAPYLLYAQWQNSTATGAGDQILFTFAVPADLLDQARGIRFVFYARRTTGSSGTIQPKLLFGGNQITSTGAISGNTIRYEGILWNAGAPNVQGGFVNSTIGATTATTSISGAEDTTSTLNLQFAVALATTTNVITLDWASLELMFAP